MHWNPSGRPGSNPECAMRRTAVSPAQRAEMRGDISGSDALPEFERTHGKIAWQKTSGRAQMSGAVHWEIRVTRRSCAARRSVVFPMQSGRTWRDVLESDGLLQPERAMRDKSMPGKRRLCPGVRSSVTRDSLDTVKAILPKSQSPGDANVHPPEIRPKPAPHPATAFFRGRCNLQSVERYPVRVFKVMSAAPRGALPYSRLSREELGGRFLDLMPYLDPKGEGNRSMAANQ
jgi:hypothetical protein